MFRSWDDLPKYMRNEKVRPYYNILKKRRISLFFKRAFDVSVATVMFILLLPVFVVISVAVMLDSRGGVFFTQERITQYGRKFKIIKFRTMVKDAERLGSQVTVSNDMRVTRVGKFLRKYRIDELPQLINVILGDMSFVGTRPEVIRYVKRYSPEMMATLLLPAGITSEASILYKDEEKLLEAADDVDEVYVHDVLPAKMKYNLHSVKHFSFFGELATMVKTVLAVLKKEDKEAVRDALEEICYEVVSADIDKKYRKALVSQVTDIHIKTFTGFFLTFLGEGFLRQLYTGFLQHDKSGLIVAKIKGRVVGFLAYSEDLSGFYKYLIKRKLIPFAWYSLLAAIKKPSAMLRLIKAFLKPSESKRFEDYVELSSIGVLPEYKNQSIGTELIVELKDLYEKDNDFEYIKLETDAIDNDAANAFYIKNEFVLDHEYTTDEGRRMNEYRYRL